MTMVVASSATRGRRENNGDGCPVR